MKKVMGILGLTSLFLMTGCSTKTVIDHDISKYDYYLNICKAKSDRFMPTLDSLNDYQRLDFSYKKPSFSGSQSLSLQVTYDEEHYAQKVEEINNTYVFLSAPIRDNDEDYVIPVHEFTYEHYQIRVVDNPRFFYPKGFGMIGISDTKYEIVYLYYYDVDRDRIGSLNNNEENRQEQMRKFTRYEFAFVE